MEKILEKIGLTNAESKTYLALLELRNSTAGPIINKAKITPSKIYELLEKLQRKGLVSVVTKNNVKNYEAASPERLIDYVEEQERKLKEEKKQLKEKIPELKLTQINITDNSQATIYKENKGIETALYSNVRTLPKNSTILLFGIPHFSQNTKFFYQKFFKHCINDLKLKIKILLHPSQKEQLKEIYLSKQEIKFQDIIYTSPMIIMKTSCILLPQSSAEPIAIVLENKQTIESFENEFAHLFNQKTRILSGMKSVEYLMELVLKNKGVDWIGARGYFVDANPEYIKNWEKRAIQKNIQTRNIVDLQVKDHLVTKWSFSKTRYTLKKEFAEMSAFWIFKDKIAITNYVEGKVLVVLIENKEICELYKKQFESLWKKK